MKAINVKSIEDSQNYCEGVLNDFETGIIDKSEAMVALYEYTVQLHNLFTASLETKVQERVAEIYSLEKLDIEDCKTFKEWVHKYFNAPELDLLYKRKDGQGQYDKKTLVKKYELAMKIKSSCE